MEGTNEGEHAGGRRPTLRGTTWQGHTGRRPRRRFRAMGSQPRTPPGPTSFVVAVAR